MAAKKFQPQQSSLSPEQTLDLIQRQIDAGQKLPPSPYILEDNDEHVTHWRTVTDGILKRYDLSWASQFFNAQHAFSGDGGRKEQIAKLRAFVDLLKIQLSHPAPEVAPQPAPTPRMPTSIRVTGPNARVNVHSIDQSTNTVETHVELWAELAAAIQMVPEPDRAQLVTAAAAMKQAHGKPSFMQRYKDFMANAANHVAVLGPIVAKLASLL
jgi:hypothetical protein